MEYYLFKQTLKDNGLTLKKFSDLSGVKYDTCSKWGKGNRSVSDWVSSWLDLFAEVEECRKLKGMLKCTLGMENV